jgi:Tfp pilus assembly protein PilF
MKKVAIYVVLAFVSLIVGFLVCSHMHIAVKRQSAAAEVYLAGEAIRAADFVQAMQHAQGVIHEAPDAYDGYLLAGDVYKRQGFNLGARTMYETAIVKLNHGGDDSLLLEKGLVDVSSARTHVQKKLADTPP